MVRKRKGIRVRRGVRIHPPADIGQIFEKSVSFGSQVNMTLATQFYAEISLGTQVGYQSYVWEEFYGAVQFGIQVGYNTTIKRLWEEVAKPSGNWKEKKN